MGLHLALDVRPESLSRRGAMRWPLSMHSMHKSLRPQLLAALQGFALRTCSIDHSQKMSCMWCSTFQAGSTSNSLLSYAGWSSYLEQHTIRLQSLLSLSKKVHSWTAALFYFKSHISLTTLSAKRSKIEDMLVLLLSHWRQHQPGCCPSGSLIYVNPLLVILSFHN